MFLWFISPWEAARLSLEAQRVMAFQFLGFASGQDRQRQEVLSDGGKALVHDVVDPSVVASVTPAASAGSMAIGRRKAVGVRKAMAVVRTPVGIKERSHKKMKGKGSRRKDKSRRQ
jgi:hypothetical protein